MLPPIMHQLSTIIALVYVTQLGVVLAAESPAKPVHPIEFNRDVRPILSDNCFKCHGLDERARKAGLRLDLRDSATRPNDLGGIAILPGKPGQSELVRRIFSSDPATRMPPPSESNKQLTQREKELLAEWIRQGAEYQPHWSFLPPRPVPLPAVQDSTWPRNPIDRFILARLEAESLRPSRSADRTTLIRRLSFDLTGLPPTPAEIDAFLADDRADAYDRLVDRLLNSPRYGERMAVEWLDAARFADTHGYHIDSGRDMTRWRDWVINAFNRNMPFDQFTIDQLAGDLRPAATLDQQIASGFNRNHMINFEGGAIPEEYHNAYIVDRVNTTSTVWLGLTVGCAQCHDHKYDPISQAEYYQLYAFFHNVPENGLDGRTGNAPPLLKFPSAAQQKQSDALNTAIQDLERRLAEPIAEVDAAQAEWERTARADAAAAAALPTRIRDIITLEPDARSDAQKAELRKHYRTQVDPTTKQINEDLTARRKEQTELERRIVSVMVMREMERPRETFLLMRGEYDKKGDRVAAGVPDALPPLPSGTRGDRLGFAEWLVQPDHPLTARVIVNRYWQMYFGTGIVKTSEDFGSQGDWPSHPELLDWLASEFRDSGWDVKHIQRLIVTSATYRQSSAVGPEQYAADPENRLLARGPRLRLQVEFIRDQALAVAGLIDHEIGGRSVSPYQPPGIWEELASRQDGKNWTAQEYVQDHGVDLYRRTMYTFIKRTAPPPSLVTFDAPDRETCTVRRPRTNTPLQALILMNDPTYVEAARNVAERLMRELGPAAAPADRITLAFRLATARRPTALELQLLLDQFTEQLARYRGDEPAARKLLAVGESPRDPSLDAAELAAWTVVANTILNLDETLTKG